MTVTQAIAERSRQEVAFWKNQLDHAVEEKNALLDRYTALYRHAFELEQYAVQLGSENHELQHVLEQTLSDERRVQVSAAGLRSSFSGLPSSSSPVPPGGNAALVSAIPCCAVLHWLCQGNSRLVEWLLHLCFGDWWYRGGWCGAGAALRGKAMAVCVDAHAMGNAVRACLLIRLTSSEASSCTSISVLSPLGAEYSFCMHVCVLRHVQDARTLTQHLTTTRTALKQADVRIAILEERIMNLQQVRVTERLVRGVHLLRDVGQLWACVSIGNTLYHACKLQVLSCVLRRQR